MPNDGTTQQTTQTGSQSQSADASLLSQASAQSGDSGKGSETKPTDSQTQTQKQSAEGQAESQPADKKTESKDGSADDKTKQQPQGAPEKYDFKLPEGMKVDAAVLEKFSGVAKELNLSQENAQKIVDLQVNAVTEAAKKQLEHFKAIQNEWQTETRNWLGDKYEQEMAFGATAINQLCPDPEKFRQFLSETGLGNRRDFVEFVINVGKKVAEDKVTEGSRNQGEKKSVGEVFYGDSMKKNK